MLFPHCVRYVDVEMERSSVNFTDRMRAARMRSSGFGVGGKVKCEVSEDNMQTARASVSLGSSARESRDCMAGMDGELEDIEVGMRVLRCSAGPGDVLA